jgi:hypothetical protein
VENPDAIIEDAIEDFERIADQRNNVNARALGYTLRGQRFVRDARDHAPDAGFERYGNGFAVRKTIR